MLPKKYWLYIGTAVFFGLLIHVLQNVRSTDHAPSLEAGLVQDDFNVHKGSGFVAPKKERLDTKTKTVLDQSKGIPVNLNGLSTAPKKTAAAKKQDKKKKKKARKKKKSNTLQVQTTDKAKSGLVSEPTTSYGGGALPRSTTPLSTPENADAAIPQTIQEWAQILLRQADWNEATKFIGYFLENKITGDVFYGVIDILINDSRPEIQEVGVFCLGSTPSLTSFETLVQITKTKFGTQAKKSADYYLLAYTQTLNLRHLAVVMKNERNADLSREALRLFQMSMESNLKPLTQSTSPNPSGSNQQPSQQDQDAKRPPGAKKQSLQASQLVRFYSPFVTVLQHLAQKSPDASLRKEATQQLNQLQARLKQLLPSPRQVATNE